MGSAYVPRAAHRRVVCVAGAGVGAFVMRGAGCTINDMWDKEYDAKVCGLWLGGGRLRSTFTGSVGV